jgi:N-terminal domain of anti-restriction factor ArdC
MKTTTSSVTPISENPKQPQPRQTAKEVIAANVKSLIEQLEAGHSDALTAYLDAMSRFHNYSFGNILEIARQRPDATRVAGMYAWNQLGRKVKKGERGIRILAPIVGVKRKKDGEAEKDITKQNTRVLVGFRNAYVFDVSQTEGAELPTLREMSGSVGENRTRLIAFINKQNIELVFTENIAPALGTSYGGRIAPPTARRASSRRGAGLPRSSQSGRTEVQRRADRRKDWQDPGLCHHPYQTH